MSIYKRGCDKKGPNGTCSKCGDRGSCGVYWYKFMWNGQLIRESTKQGNDKVARKMEAAHRTRLAEGLVGIREKKPIPTLTEFLKNDFISYAEAKHSAKPGTLEYYRDGTKMIQKCDWAGEKLDQISDQHAHRLAAKFANLSPSRINCGLRALRRALNLAYEWGKIERPVKITLAKGERQRNRVLTESEWQQYIVECPQPWRDIATIVRGTGMRPGEAFNLQWQNVHLNGNAGLIQITEGKTKAARRLLPMIPAVYAALKTRYELAGKPEQGWVFPSSSRDGHFNKDTAKDQHAKAIVAANVKAATNGAKPLQPFQPYILRHTALTELAQAGCDVFTLARIAGHSSIAITQRYVHPQADAIERAFATVAGTPTLTPRVGTKLGTMKRRPRSESRQVLGAKGGTRTPTVLPARS